METLFVKKCWQQVLFEKNKGRENVFLHKIVSEGKTTYHAQILLVDILLNPNYALSKEIQNKIEIRNLTLNDLMRQSQLEKLQEVYFSDSLSQDPTEDLENQKLKEQIKNYFDILIFNYKKEKIKKFSTQNYHYHAFICREIYRAWEELAPHLDKMIEKEKLEKIVSLPNTKTEKKLKI